jgi:hypothetical protein
MGGRLDASGTPASSALRCRSTTNSVGSAAASGAPGVLGGQVVGALHRPDRAGGLDQDRGQPLVTWPGAHLGAFADRLVPPVPGRLWRPRCAAEGKRGMSPPGSPG